MYYVVFMCVSLTKRNTLDRYTMTIPLLRYLTHVGIAKLKANISTSVRNLQ